jgi:hypothetical protein
MCANRLPVTKEPTLKVIILNPFQETMKNKNPNVVLPPKTEVALIAAKGSESQTKLLVVFSHHI